MGTLREEGGSVNFHWLVRAWLSTVNVVAFSGMSTVAEIVEAVARLSRAERCELVTRLEPVLLGKPSLLSADQRAYADPEFTTRLVEHFHAAKRAALSHAGNT